MRAMMRAACLRASSAVSVPWRPTVTRFERPKARVWIDVDLGTRRVDPDAESRQVAIPEHGVLVIDRKTIHNAFGEGEVLKFRHHDSS